MRCPYCLYDDTKVLETRETAEDTTRRRRECLKCQKRFTTYEAMELDDVLVLKKDGRKESFDKLKIINSIRMASRKRPVSEKAIETIAISIEAKIRSSKEDITSKKIGNMILRRLEKLDEVTYVRFASVYKEFADIETFAKILEKLKEKKEQKEKLIVIQE